MANFSPLTAEIGCWVSGTQPISSGFVSWLCYCSDVAHCRPTKLCTMFGHLLGWYTIYTFSGALALTEFCQVQNSLCVQVLRLYWQCHCTALQQRISAKLCCVVQGMELGNFHRRLYLYSPGRPSRWAAAHILVIAYFFEGTIFMYLTFLLSFTVDIFNHHFFYFFKAFRETLIPLSALMENESLPLTMQWMHTCDIHLANKSWHKFHYI